jgi:hypothetical protein
MIIENPKLIPASGSGKEFLYFVMKKMATKIAL